MTRGAVEPGDAQRAARHVAYELGMLRTTYGTLRGGNIVVLEDFLVHTRNLIEFFWDRASPRAILPRDFGAPAGRDKNRQIAALHSEISQLLSHLTWERVRIHELRTQDWSYARARGIYDAIRDKAKAFFDVLPEERRAWFASKVFRNEYKNWV